MVKSSFGQIMENGLAAYQKIRPNIWILLCILLLGACKPFINSAPTNNPTELIPTHTPNHNQTQNSATASTNPADTEPSRTDSILNQVTSSPTSDLSIPPDSTQTRSLSSMNAQTPTNTIFSPSPTITETPRPEIPQAAIRIQRPAPLSRVTSPVQVRAVLAPGAGGMFRIELIGEDGRLLSRQLLKYSGEKVNASVDLEFEIPGVAETGRIQIYTLDEYDRMIAMSSSNIILMSVGKDDYNTASDLRERILILQPTTEDLILGGSLTIFGKAWPNIDSEPLLVELITESGGVIGQRLVAVNPESGEDYGIFTTEIPYQVSEPTKVRLTVYEDIDRIPGKTHITTLEITVNP